MREGSVDLSRPALLTGSSSTISLSMRNPSRRLSRVAGVPVGRRGEAAEEGFVVLADRRGHGPRARQTRQSRPGGPVARTLPNGAAGVGVDASRMALGPCARPTGCSGGAWQSGSHGAVL